MPAETGRIAWHVITAELHTGMLTLAFASLVIRLAGVWVTTSNGVWRGLVRLAGPTALLAAVGGGRGTDRPDSHPAPLRRPPPRGRGGGQACRQEPESRPPGGGECAGSRGAGCGPTPDALADGGAGGQSVNTAVGLVGNYLRLNGYFTVTEYQVQHPVPGQPGKYETATDLDILAIRLPWAAETVLRHPARPGESRCEVLLVDDPHVGVALDLFAAVDGDAK